ncbi:MAG: hypothetical protein JO142_04035 [Burkholderiales bacterium]|nr:hypothetical protein [Burkholderiales bacterium]
MADHTLKKIDTDIAHALESLSGMGKLVLHQLGEAMTIVEKCYMELGVSLDKLEDKLNERQVFIDRECTQFIALHQPSASDLRTILATMRIANELESVGQAACQIGRAGERIHKGGRKLVVALEPLMAEYRIAFQMLEMAIAAIAASDIKVAAKLVAEQLALHEACANVQAQILAGLVESQGANASSLDTSGIARTLLRVGELAQRIAAHVVYRVTGNDVRHADLATLEQVASQAH